VHGRTADDPSNLNRRPGSKRVDSRVPVVQTEEFREKLLSDICDKAAKHKAAHEPDLPVMWSAGQALGPGVDASKERRMACDSIVEEFEDELGDLVRRDKAATDWCYHHVAGCSRHATSQERRAEDTTREFSNGLADSLVANAKARKKARKKAKPKRTPGWKRDEMRSRGEL
jgi:hypothetical protein